MPTGIALRTATCGKKWPVFVEVGGGYMAVAIPQSGHRGRDILCSPSLLPLGADVFAAAYKPETAARAAAYCSPP